jgi:hypothetical protein
MSDRAAAATGMSLNDIQKRVPPWARATVLSGMCGSHVHGTWIPPTDPEGTDDVDVFSVIIHPRNHYLGLPYFLHDRQSFQTHGEGLDIAVFEGVHYVNLCAKGNPNVNLWLWLQPHEYFSRAAAGDILIAARNAFLSKRMFLAFAGYAYAQLKRMTHGERMGYMGAKRKQLFNEKGFDTKNAAHCLRLFYTAIILLQTGLLIPKLNGYPLETVLAVKKGLKPIGEVERLATDLDAEFKALVQRRGNDFPDRPDPDTINNIVRDILETSWSI